MAGLPLNTFKTVRANVTDALISVYEAPLGITSIVLMAQVANVDESTSWVTFKHYSNADDVQTFIVKEIDVPSNDARILLGGKLVLQTGDRILVQAEANNRLEFIASILETANQ